MTFGVPSLPSISLSWDHRGLDVRGNAGATERSSPSRRADHRSVFHAFSGPLKMTQLGCSVSDEFVPQQLSPDVEGTTASWHRRDPAILANELASLINAYHSRYMGALHPRWQRYSRYNLVVAGPIFGVAICSDLAAQTADKRRRTSGTSSPAPGLLPRFGMRSKAGWLWCRPAAKCRAQSLRGRVSSLSPQVSSGRSGDRGSATNNVPVMADDQFDDSPASAGDLC